MAINKVELCGVNTSRLPVLNAEEKETLLKKAREGDAAARERYIQGNLRLVLSVIKRFSNSSENADDLFQIGCIGLIKAIDNFDTTLNVRFSTYAVPMIIGEIRRYLRDNNAIRVSRSLRDTAYRAICARELYLKHQRRDHQEYDPSALPSIVAVLRLIVLRFFVFGVVIQETHLPSVKTWEVLVGNFLLQILSHSPRIYKEEPAPAGKFSVNCEIGIEVSERSCYTIS